MSFFGWNRDTQIGFVQHLPDNISEKELLSDGYRTFTSNELSQLNLLVAQSARFSILKTVTEKSWIVYLPNGVGGLQASKQIPGTFNPMTVDNRGRYTSVATIKPLMSSNSILMMNAFAAMSIVTGQYYLTEINDKLTHIEEGVNSILDFLDNDKKSRIIANAATLDRIQSNLSSICSNEIQSKETVSTLQSITREALADAFFYRERITSLQNKLNKSDRKDRILSNISSIRMDLFLYEYSLSIYAVGLYLESVISRQSDVNYIQGMIEGLEENRIDFMGVAENSQNVLTAYIENATAYSGEKILVGIVNAPALDWMPWMKDVRKNIRADNGDQEKARDIISAIAVDAEKLEVLSAVEDSFQSYKQIMNGPVEIVHSDNVYYLRVG